MTSENENHEQMPSKEEEANEEEANVEAPARKGTLEDLKALLEDAESGATGFVEPATEEVSDAAEGSVPRSEPMSGEGAPEAENDASKNDEDRVRFDDLPLAPEIVGAVSKLGFEFATPIQAEAIPKLIEGYDVIGRARTGSGKTAAFGLPLVQHLAEGSAKHVRGLILAPTRELALQVSTAMQNYAKGLPIRIATIYGGAPYPPQIKALRKGASIVVGTPGRVIDHLERGTLDLSRLQMLVLDEADEMLRMGFLEDVERVLESAPDERQIALFSATMPREIKRIAETHLTDPVEVQVEDKALTTSHIEQRYIVVPERHRTETLERILAARPPGATLVFARTRRGCAEVADTLAKRGLPVDALHGDLNQAARERVLTRLRAKRLNIVVATDVAARGIDVDHLTLVVNLELPQNPELYVHRIGRTGRAGREGNAVTFVGPHQLRKLGWFSKTVGADIKEDLVPSDAEIEAARRAELAESIRVAAESTPPTLLGELSQDLREDLGLSDDEIARAALQLLAEAREIDLERTPALRRPRWAKDEVGHKPRKERPKRDYGDRPKRQRGADGKDPANAVTFFLPIGASKGVRPGDLVGAITNEAGITSGEIGKVRVLPHKSFVSVTEEASQAILGEIDKIQVRRFVVPLAKAREWAPREGGERRGGRGGDHRGGDRRGGEHRGGDHRSGEYRGERSDDERDERGNRGFRKPGRRPFKGKPGRKKFGKKGPGGKFKKKR